MRIPNKIIIGPRMIKVIKISNNDASESGSYGTWCNDSNTITYSPNGIRTPSDNIYNNSEPHFFHECQHAIFEITGYPKLSKNEGLVDASAFLWWQVCKQLKGGGK